MNSIPVVIAGGFLGAGKTTLINHILEGDHGRRIAILVNDFGEINIDSQLITHVTGETISLANGCVCCTIRDDLVDAVFELTTRQPQPEYILVETSGISEPAAAAMGIASSTKLSQKAHLDAVITVVDAENVRKLAGNQKSLAIDQIESAHIVLLNKTDLVSTAEVAAIEAWIADISPSARIVQTHNCVVPVELILGIGNTPRNKLTLPHTHDHAHDHSTAFATWNWTGAEPLDFEAIYAFFKALPLSVFRAKGILYLREVPDKQVILQMVGPRVTLSKAAPWNDSPPRSQIVLIGASGTIDGNELGQQISACTSSDDDKPPNRLADAVVEILRRP